MKQFFGFGPAGDIPAGFFTNQIYGFFSHGAQGGGLAADQRNQAFQIILFFVIETVKGAADSKGILRLIFYNQGARRAPDRMCGGFLD